MPPRIDRDFVLDLAVAVEIARRPRSAGCPPIGMSIGGAISAPRKSDAVGQRLPQKCSDLVR